MSELPDRIIVVEDDREVRSLVHDLLAEAGYAVAPFASPLQSLRELDGDADVDLVVTDLSMPGMSGSELLQQVSRRRPELNVIIITAFGSIESAIELVKLGAFDYITKPFSTDDLLFAVERGLADSEVRRRIARQRSASAEAPPGFISASDVMRAVFKVIARAAPTRYPMLITGETGTGKELIARRVHELSGRTPLVSVNCAALPSHLLESELFGHERGAFSGADRQKAGLFEAADGGTLFLDEIAELPLDLQPKLLRTLETGELRRVGSNHSQHVDVRIIAATNKDIAEEVRESRFRNDLFWRLNVLAVEIPPLRERAADILLLAEHFLNEASGGAKSFSSGAQALLREYAWPGNVRELRNAVYRAAAMGPGDVVQAIDLPSRIGETARIAALIHDSSDRQLTLHELERAYIAEVLRRTSGNKSRSAEILGIDRATLYRKLEEYRKDETAQY